jgi:hypothetical protein
MGNENKNTGRHRNGSTSGRTRIPDIPTWNPSYLVRMHTVRLAASSCLSCTLDSYVNQKLGRIILGLDSELNLHFFGGEAHVHSSRTIQGTGPRHRMGNENKTKKEPEKDRIAAPRVGSTSSRTRIPDIPTGIFHIWSGCAPCALLPRQASPVPWIGM